MVIELKLSRGYATIIDDVDSDLAQYKWSAGSRNLPYATREIHVDGKSKHPILHRIILSRVLGREMARHEVCDHINGDPLDNRRENLRLATNTQNLRNRKRNKNNSTGFKGVYKTGKRFKAEIGFNGEKRYIGTFDTPEEAHEAYKKVAIELHGEFARFE